MPIIKPADLKRELIDEFVRTVVIHTLPLIFADQNPGFLGLARTPIEIGQSYSVVSSVDVNPLIPSESAVR